MASIGFFLTDYLFTGRGRYMLMDEFKKSFLKLDREIVLV